MLRGPLSIYTGYSKLFRNFVRGLVKIKYPFELSPISNLIPYNAEKDLKALITNSAINPTTGILFGYPIHINQLSNQNKIIYTMYETTSIPHEWEEGVKRASGIFVPSEFCNAIFSKYNEHVTTVNPGIDTDIFNANSERIQNSQFTIGACGVMSKRKGVDILVDAFIKAFPSNNDVKLLIKTRDTRWLPPLVDSRVFIIPDDWTEERLAKFYRSLDLFVNVSRGEGLSYPPLEAACCGTLSLATRWSGPTEYIDDKNIFGIEITGLEPVPPKTMEFADADHLWATPSIDDLVDKLRFFYDNNRRIKIDNIYWSQVESAKRLKKAISQWN